MSQENRIDEVFAKQTQASRSDSYPSLQVRLDNLEKLSQLIINNQDAICEAVNKDFGNRCAQETRLLEITGLVSAISYSKKRLKKWMKPKKRHASIAFFGAKNTVLPQPKGVVGVITPWNYPLFLALSPCISAMSAGNRCIVKLAANSQNLCRLLDKLVTAEFDEAFLAVIPGVSASIFSDKPWDHLVFTGSAATGKIVMETAAKNLTPVTLELGGKSPTIIAEDFDVVEAAKRIVFAKFLNAGQTCVAPDYVMIPESKLEAFVAAAKEILPKRFEDLQSGDFTSIIDQKAYERLTATLDDASKNGAELISLLPGESVDETSQKIAPHIVLNVSDNMLIMQDEIFGPLLPIKTYKNLDEVIDYVNANERPLALYMFTNNKAVQEKLIYSTLSGGICINDCMFHVAQHDMPFGGIGNSGMGHYHGGEGFNEFSKLRPIFKQAKKSAVLDLAAPYGKKFERTLNLMIKFKL